MAKKSLLETYLSELSPQARIFRNQYLELFDGDFDPRFVARETRTNISFVEE